MIASSPDRKTRWYLPALTAALLTVVQLPFGPAWGQSQGQTAPAAVQSEEIGAPTQLIPFDRSSREGSGALPGEALPEVQGIVIDRLRALDPNAIGLLDPDKEGLGQGLWQVSERARLEALLAGMPGDLQSATLRRLARRMLLSRAAPPKVEAAAAETAIEEGGAAVVAPRFLSLRIGRLLAIGEVENLHRLLGSVPRMIDDEGIQRARAEVGFLRGDLDGGCREVRNGVTAHVAHPYWQKALVLCQLVTGERAQAQLGLSLLQERGIEGDEAAFLALFDALSSGEADAGEAVPAEAIAEPLPFAALQSVGLAPGEGFVETAPAGLLVAAALSDKTPLAMRIAAAERAVALGVLEREYLAEAYGEASFGAEALLASDEAGFEGAELRALRYQRIARREEPGSRARALREALSAAESAGLYRAMLPLVLDEFAKVPVQGGLAWFAGTAGRALYAAGRIEAAGAWYQLARDQAVRNSAARIATSALWPYFRLSGGPTFSQGDPVATWREGLGEAVDDTAAMRWEALLRAGLVGLNPGQSPAAGNPTASEDGVENADLIALKAASGDGRRGETLLITLGLIGAVPPADYEPAALEAVLAALVRSGLDGEARALAIEAMVANGL